MPPPRLLKGLLNSPSRCSYRLFSTSRSRYQALSLSADSYAGLSSRSLLVLSGRDVSSFLQGITTANVPPPINDDTTSSWSPSLYSAFLNAQGRILNDVFLYPNAQNLVTAEKEKENTWLIEVDNAQRIDLLKWLKRYKLRSKLALRAVEEGEIGVGFAWQDNGRDFPPLQASNNAGSASSRVLVTKDARAPGLGARIIGTMDEKGCPQDLIVEANVVDEKAYHERRMIYGVPEGQNELVKGHSLIQESNMDYMGAVDFRKGCYVGQELVIRTQHTGVVRKRIMPVQLASSEEVDLSTIGNGTDIKVEGKPRRVGTWTGGLGNKGLALLRLEQAGLDLDGKGEAMSLYMQGAEGNNITLKVHSPDWWLERKQALARGGSVNGNDAEKEEFDVVEEDDEELLEEDDIEDEEHLRQK